MRIPTSNPSVNSREDQNSSALSVFAYRNFGAIFASSCTQSCIQSVLLAKDLEAPVRHLIEEDITLIES